MSPLHALLTILLLIVPPAVLADPPNHAASVVPYDLPATAKYDYSEALHKVSTQKWWWNSSRMLISVLRSRYYFIMLNAPANSQTTVAWRGGATAVFNALAGGAKISRVVTTKQRTQWCGHFPFLRGR